jgi:uncharacterized integral membrane protein
VKRIGTLVTVLISLAGAVWALFFCLANADGVSLDLVFVELRPAPVGVWVLSAFAIGGVTGLLASSAALWRGRRI